ALGEPPRATDVLGTEETSIDRQRWEQITRLCPVIARALTTQVGERYASAKAMAAALRRAVSPASATDVAAWVRTSGAEYLAQREEALESFGDGDGERISGSRFISAVAED